MYTMPTPEWHEELSLLRKKLWVYSTYCARKEAKPEVRERLWSEVKEACRQVAWEEQ